jgi:hypothetical protein
VIHFVKNLNLLKQCNENQKSGWVVSDGYPFPTTGQPFWKVTLSTSIILLVFPIYPFGHAWYTIAQEPVKLLTTEQWPGPYQELVV